MKKPIIDLHCDLLLYLASGEGRTAHDHAARCSIPLLQSGGVTFQVLAIFTETGVGSAVSAAKQTACYQNLPKLYTEFEHAYSPRIGKNIGIMPAIENASGFFEEDEPLVKGMERLRHFIDTVAKPLYISLTWNDENRFGGGNFSKAGLKEEGKELLDFLNGKQIAIDLSHTSDALAEGILNHIDAKGLDLRVIASHSNYRAVTKQPRNLPDKFVCEIVRRGGVIGFNAVRPFICKEGIPVFEEHLEYAIKLGAEDSICFGADFFYDGDVVSHYKMPSFFEDYGNAGCYPKILELWKSRLGVDDRLLSKICHQNFERFFATLRG